MEKSAPDGSGTPPGNLTVGAAFAVATDVYPGKFAGIHRYRQQRPMTVLDPDFMFQRGSKFRKYFGTMWYRSFIKAIDTSLRTQTEVFT